jgi:hypothetical protein
MAKGTGMAKGNKVAGGLGSRVVRHVGYVNGRPATEIRPAGVAQFGSNLGNKSTDGSKKLTKAVEPVHGKPRPEGSPGGVKLGNELAANVGKGGPGAGYVQYGQAGTNCQTGPAAPGNPPPKGELFPGWPTKQR